MLGAHARDSRVVGPFAGEAPAVEAGWGCADYIKERGCVMKRINAFNVRLARAVTAGVGTMWCAYIFAALALVSLPEALSTGDLVVIVAWIAQTFLQLVLLSVILVAQNAQSDLHQQTVESLQVLHDKHDSLAARIEEHFSGATAPVTPSIEPDPQH